MKKAVVVAIPTLNEAEFIRAAIQSLMVDLPEGKVTFVVVDGGSTDGTQALVEAMGESRDDVILIRNVGRLQSIGVNLVARQFVKEADVLVRCDAHSVYPPGYIRRLVESLEAHGSSSIAVVLDTVGVGGLQQAIAAISNSPIGTGGSAHRAGSNSGFVDHGHHAAFDMKAFMRIGGYDETFSHNEDVEFDCRLRASGQTIYLDASIRVAYAPRSTLRALFLQYFRYGVGRSRTSRLHPTSFKARHLCLAGGVTACFLSLCLGFIEPAFFLMPVCYSALLLMTSLIVAVRQSSLHGLWAGPAAALMHFGWVAGFIYGFLIACRRDFLSSSRHIASRNTLPGLE